MNPLIIKIGALAVVSVFTILFTVWRSSRRLQQSSPTTCNNYDGSNMSMCCICLKEFSLLKKEGSEVITFPCLHKICKDCCVQLFLYMDSYNRTCPQCRKPIPEQSCLFKLNH